ncbi:unnamed protein product [Amoebophrya sp. A120]|nr:unnamed protein product [Amoebophrya sp. A120]|eukprot:GSA120T00016350001.1
MLSPLQQSRWRLAITLLALYYTAGVIVFPLVERQAELDTYEQNRALYKAMKKLYSFEYCNDPAFEGLSFCKNQEKFSETLQDYFNNGADYDYELLKSEAKAVKSKTDLLSTIATRTAELKLFGFGGRKLLFGKQQGGDEGEAATTSGDDATEAEQEDAQQRIIPEFASSLPPSSSRMPSVPATEITQEHSTENKRAINTSSEQEDHQSAKSPSHHDERQPARPGHDSYHHDGFNNVAVRKMSKQNENGSNVHDISTRGSALQTGIETRISSSTKTSSSDKNRSSRRNSLVDQNNWSFCGTLFFLTSLATTIGYGHSHPVTSGGQMLTIAFGVVGLPIMAFNLLLIAEAWFSVGAKARVVNLQSKNSRLLFLISLLVAFLLFGASLFHRLEPSWTFLESLYFCFVTLSAVGFGDYTPSSNLSRVVAILYMIFGLGVCASLLATLTGLVEVVSRNNFGDGKTNQATPKAEGTGAPESAFAATGTNPGQDDLEAEVESDSAAPQLAWAWDAETPQVLFQEQQDEEGKARRAG